MVFLDLESNFRLDFMVLVFGSIMGKVISIVCFRENKINIF